VRFKKEKNLPQKKKTLAFKGGGTLVVVGNRVSPAPFSFSVSSEAANIFTAYIL